VAAWLGRPLGRGNACALVVLVCSAPAWLIADPLQTFILINDDFAYVADARTASRLLSTFWTPHNAHIVPLFRLWTYLLVMIAGRLENMPVVLAVASYGVLVLVMLAAGIVAARETGESSLGLAVMALLGVTTVIEPATVWYSAGQALWASLMILIMLAALQSWRASGGTWRLAAAGTAAVAAPLFWTGGLAAGPVGWAYLWTSGGARARRAAAVPIVCTVLVGLVALVSQANSVAFVPGGRTLIPLAWRAIAGALHTSQGVVEVLVLGNLGHDAETTATQGVVLTLALGLLWGFSRREFGRKTSLESAGVSLIVFSFLLVFTFRGDYPYSSLRALGWYHAIPQVGASLFVAGWWQAIVLVGSSAERIRPPSRRGAACVLALLVVLLILHEPRAARLFVGQEVAEAEPVQRWNSLVSARIDQARSLARERLREQRRFLARLDQADRVGRRQGIGRKAIHDVFGRLLGPGMPKEVASLDGADLLALPWDGPETDRARIQAALGEILGQRFHPSGLSNPEHSRELRTPNAQP
jgi:hypothetical protein